MTHTPGPWAYENWGVWKDMQPLADICSIPANGILMAAAPDMLEALENIREVIKDLPGVRVQANNISADLAVSCVFERIDKAIAKAKGNE